MQVEVTSNGQDFSKSGVKVSHGILGCSRQQMQQSNRSRVLAIRVQGLQNDQQYNELESVVLIQNGDPHVCVRLDPDNTQLRLKLQNILPLVPTAIECKEL